MVVLLSIGRGVTYPDHGPGCAPSTFRGEVAAPDAGRGEDRSATGESHGRPPSSSSTPPAGWPPSATPAARPDPERATMPAAASSARPARRLGGRGRPGKRWGARLGQLWDRIVEGAARSTGRGPRRSQNVAGDRLRSWESHGSGSGTRDTYPVSLLSQASADEVGRRGGHRGRLRRPPLPADPPARRPEAPTRRTSGWGMASRPVRLVLAGREAGSALRPHHPASRDRGARRRHAALARLLPARRRRRRLLRALRRRGSSPGRCGSATPSSRWGMPNETRRPVPQPPAREDPLRRGRGGQPGRRPGRGRSHPGRWS